MSRSGRPPLAGGSAVAAGKNISKLSRHVLSSRRAVDCAKLLANLAGDRAGRPASLAADPLTPLTPTSLPTRSERYALRSAEKSIDKTLAEHSSPNGAECNPLAESASFVPGDVSEGDDCSSGGDQHMEHQCRQRDTALSAMAPLKPPPLEVVFQPPNDPGVKDVQVDTQVTPATRVVADSVLDDMFNTWRCGSCTYQNLGKAKGACAMCNDPHPIRTGLSLDPGRLVNWKHVPPSHCAKWLPLPPLTTWSAQHVNHTSSTPSTP